MRKVRQGMGRLGGCGNHKIYKYNKKAPDLYFKTRNFPFQKILVYELLSNCSRCSVVMVFLFVFFARLSLLVCFMYRGNFVWANSLELPLKQRVLGRKKITSLIEFSGRLSEFSQNFELSARGFLSVVYLVIVV